MLFLIFLGICGGGFLGISLLSIFEFFECIFFSILFSCVYFLKKTKFNKIFERTFVNAKTKNNYTFKRRNAVANLATDGYRV